MMHRTAGLLSLSVLLGGCLKEDDFVVEYNEAVCAWLSDCNETIDVDECLQDATATEVSLPESCDYHSREARRCLKGMWDLECPRRTIDVTLPAACDLVWDC
jgi:hypothetical protein